MLSTGFFFHSSSFFSFVLNKVTQSVLFSRRPHSLMNWILYNSVIKQSSLAWYDSFYLSAPHLLTSLSLYLSLLFLSTYLPLPLSGALFSLLFSISGPSLCLSISLPFSLDLTWQMFYWWVYTRSLAAPLTLYYFANGDKTDKVLNFLLLCSSIRCDAMCISRIRCRNTVLISSNQRSNLI